MPIPYAPTCSRRSAALVAYAENRDCPRCPRDSLSPGVDGRNLPNSRARKLTEPAGPAKIADPAIHRLIDLVRVGDPTKDDAAQFRQGARVTIRTRDGREATSTVYVSKGAGVLGIAWDDVVAKYRALVPHCGLSVRAVAESLAMIHELRRVSDVKRLVGVLHVQHGEGA